MWRVYNKVSVTVLFFITFFLLSCRETEHTEEVAAEIIAAQIEGRNKARDFVNKEWHDTVKLKHALLDVKAFQSKYILEGKPKCAEAFDSSFISTIHSVNPKLAKAIKP